MEVIDIQKHKFSFSGHETFQCRQLWLKKGYEFVKREGSFSDESAVVSLGVGKNMVSSIHYWLKSFGIINKEGFLTSIAKYILDDNGKDPFLEDEATLWLLHYHLIKQNIASTYDLIFNEFRRERIEFTKDSFGNFVKRKIENSGGMKFNSKTVAMDFDIFVKMYRLTGTRELDWEDSFSGLLTDLNLLKGEQRKIDDRIENYFYIENMTRPEIPEEIILYIILNENNQGNSINLSSLENNRNNVGSVFALNRAGVIKKIENIISSKKFNPYGITFSDNAGIRELQFKIMPDPFDILDLYYGN